MSKNKCEEKITVKKESYFYCNECEIDSLTKDRLCPCARGLNCEARNVGKVVTTTEVILKKYN